MMLLLDAAVSPILQSHQTLGVLLSAAAWLAELQLQLAVGAGSSSVGVDTMELTAAAQQQTRNPSVGIWRQVLGIEQGSAVAAIACNQH
jgi:hypothetical protein